MGQSAARILFINPLALTSYGAFIFVWWFWRLSYLREVISKHVDFEAALSPRARRMVQGSMRTRHKKLPPPPVRNHCFTIALPCCNHCILTTPVLKVTPDSFDWKPFLAHLWYNERQRRLWRCDSSLCGSTTSTSDQWWNFYRTRVRSLATLVTN